MAVRPEQIRRIAELAELSVDDRTAAELGAQLTRILDYVRQLEELDAGPTGATDEGAVRLRRDVVGSDALARPPRDFAPAMQQDLFLVPRLGEMDGGQGA
jgi:aspartyl/glutamyl-tRNA(Asn/Gln) amidotransferase C subunit